MIDKMSSNNSHERKASFDNEDDGDVEEIVSPLNGDVDGVVTLSVPVKEERLAWDSKVQFLMSVISYGVGLGNVWRFPYLCQQNGGGAFLIPYFIMMLVEGIPIFLLEMAIGQRLRLGSIGVWNKIHSYIGGIGIASTIVAFLVGLYYNMIIAWCLFYFFHSFRSPLPWSECPVTHNGTEVAECYKSSSTAYFWYREAMDISPNLDESGGMKWWLVLCLFVAWLVVYLCMMRGIQTSGKVVYFTATFPYIVLVIFFVRAITLKGSDAGLAHMFTPKMDRLVDPTVWLDAATQVFYSLGLGFGSLISFSSYNPPKNDCKRDALVVSIVNCMTSVFASVVVFAVLGFKATLNLDKCIERNIHKIIDATGDQYNTTTLTVSVYESLVPTWNASVYGLETCDLQTLLDQAAEGTGLAFIVFTQAIVEFPGAPFWSLIFFLMLLTLGMGSMFGTLEGVVGNIFDLNLVSRMRKEVVTGILCFVSFLIGLVFCLGSGEYWVKIFDTCSGSMSLLLIAFFEVISVIYVYGHEKFFDDIEDMCGDYPNMCWRLMWRFVSPLIMLIVFVASLVHRIHHEPHYHGWNAETGMTEKLEYPLWASVVCTCIVLSSVLPIILVFLVRVLRCQKVETDIPASMKRIDTTVSTTGMMDNMEEMEYNDDIPASMKRIDTRGMLDNIEEMEYRDGMNGDYLQIPTGPGRRPMLRID